ncbi:hypothetical protein OOK58_42605 [Streptomyces sp. NBC_01728]|uniref:hypothetical protein n=1 Tax=unclassified Streptomyces TaxID=2593676 RepID=UPI00224F6FBB|nr:MULTISPECIES: hypothetical protein [unclassified Streptomyces]MCX4458604.1 hypothetical protein [Streptomyces sp. NBC_01719]MCX4497961.1 hypothetical protein [Streptomyces sp. NBC_01728]
MLDVSKINLDGPEQPVERREVRQPLPLVTTRYQSWKPELGYLPVGVTVGKARFFRHSHESIPALAPVELMRGPLKGIDNIAVERIVYFERLRVYEHEILAALQELAARYPDTPACLMCFEDVNAGLDCHRRWYSEWAAARYGWEIPELPNPAGTAPARPSRPKPEAPPTLF